MENTTKTVSFSEIKEQYGVLVFQTFKQIIKQRQKIAQLKNRRIFLLTCKNLQLEPKFMNFKMSHIQFEDFSLRHKFDNRLCLFKRVLLNYLISDITFAIKKINLIILNLELRIKHILDCKQGSHLKNKIHHTVEEFFKRSKHIHQTKIVNLISYKNARKQKNPKTVVNENWLVNLSNTQIPDDVSEVLGLGPNYGIEYSNVDHIPVNYIVANIESAIDHLPTTDKTSIRAKVNNVIINFKNSSKTQNYREKMEFSKKVTKTKQFIKNNPQVICIKPDKSNKSVIMNKDEYDQKINQLINDKEVYSLLGSDPTVKYRKLNNDIVKRWENSKLISKDLAKKLKINNAQCPRIYGLPKLHKPGTPLRPIVSCIQSPLYGLSKFLANSITNIINKNDYYIKNSFDFKKMVDEVILPPDHMLISLDVVSLYTNIPVDLAIAIVKEQWCHLQEYTELPLDEFCKALELTLSTTYFQFRNCYYQQIYGCAMGAPISSVIAQLVLEHLECQVIPQLNFVPVFFKRYVDDCVLCIPKDKAEYVLAQFNAFHPKLQFTIEIEKNACINFLDITMIRSGGRILTKLFKKETASGRYVNFLSTQPINHKKNVVIALADRAIKLTSPEYRCEIVNFIKEILKCNNYPDHFVNSIFKKRLHMFYNSLNSVQKNHKDGSTKFIPLPFVSKLSEKISKIVKPFNLKVAHRNYNCLKFLSSKIKDSIPIKKQTHVVYSIPCKNCPGVYIGQTMQHLNERMNGHKYSKNSTALKKHTAEYKHTFDFEGVKVIDREYNYKVRNVLELIHIKKCDNAVNDRTEIAELSTAYAGVI